MDENLLYLDKDVTSSLLPHIFNNIDTGIVIIVRENIVYLNNFIESTKINSIKFKKDKILQSRVL